MLYQLYPEQKRVGMNLPYSGKVDSEYVWGRGALDDKSGVIGILEAVTHLIESGFKPVRTIYLKFWT